MKCFRHLDVMSPQWLKLKLYRSGNSSWASSVVLALQQAFSFHGEHCEGEEAQEAEEDKKTEQEEEKENEEKKEGETKQEIHRKAIKEEVDEE